MAAAAEHVGAREDLRFELAVIVLVGVAEAQIALDAGEGLVDDEVDDAGHRVGAPGGRGAAGHDVDALDHRAREAC